MYKGKRKKSQVNFPLFQIRRVSLRIRRVRYRDVARDGVSVENVDYLVAVARQYLVCGIVFTDRTRYEWIFPEQELQEIERSRIIVSSPSC